MKRVNVGIGTFTVGAAVVAQLTRMSIPWSYRDLFEAEGKRSGIDPDLLHAIGIHESRLNPSAVSAPNRDSTRDYGLMQINESNFRLLGLTETTALQPGPNVKAAGTLLADIKKRVGDYVPDMLSIYNAGQSKLGVRPKLTVSGAYINAVYVQAVLGHYMFLKIARLAPIQRA